MSFFRRTKLHRRIEGLEARLVVAHQHIDSGDDRVVEMARDHRDELRAVEGQLADAQTRVIELEAQLAVTMRTVPELVRYALEKHS